MGLMPRKRLAPIVVPLVAATLLSACSGSNGNGPGPSTSPVPALNATTAPLLPTDAQQLPDSSPDQYRQLLGQLKGTPVVVNIWGSWCGPCREEAPLLRAASQAYGHQVQFLGVDILDVKDSARKYMDQFGLHFPSVFDPSGGGDIRNSLGYIGQPDTIFYDAAGNEVDHWEGAISKARLEQGIHEILPAATASGSPPTATSSP